MRIRFKKDHTVHKAGDVAEDHPNAAYLVRIGVAEQVKEKKETEQKPEKVQQKHTPKKKH